MNLFNLTTMEHNAMMTITLDDNLVNQVVAVTHYHNAQEAVIKALSEYVQQHSVSSPATHSLFEQLRLDEETRGDDLAALFERNQEPIRTVNL